MKSDPRVETRRHGWLGQMSNQARTLIVCVITVVTIMGLVLVGPIPQDEGYHGFADQRSMLGIPNFLNVASNVPFLLTGLAGLGFVLGYALPSTGSFINRFERLPYVSFFLGITLTCFGSAYYHLAPTSDRLVWDRMPMSIAFMSLLAATIAERINVRAGLVLLAPLVLVGAASVIYWHVGEQSGSGDLRPYVLVQFYSLLAVILSAVLFPSRYTRGRDILIAAGVYALAKLMEVLDSLILSIGGIVSGHTLKHIVAAAAIFLVLRMLKHRTPAPEDRLAKDVA
jgi:hypothetical protein